MSAGHAVVVGSGAGASVAAWTLTDAGWDVTILEKGRNYFRGLDDPLGIGPPTFGNDELRGARDYPGHDPLGDPRTGRTQQQAAAGVERSYTGALNNLPQTVGGGTVHWDAKVPRFWKDDFRMRSLYGPVPNADVADWPFDYDDLTPYYDRVEDVMGVAGSLADTPAYVLERAPRGEYPMPAGPPMYAATVFNAGARKLGYQPFPFVMAHNTVERDGRPPCNDCGFCSHYGCPTYARGGAAVFLRRALLAGAELRTRACVTRVLVEGDRAVGVEYLPGPGRAPVRVDADVVVLGASAVETPRLVLRSGFGNSSDRVGRYLAFHADTFAAGQVPQRLHQYRGRSGSHCMLEPAIPDTKAGRFLGLPYVRGGVVEIGGAPMLIEEAGIYDGLPLTRGVNHKKLMRGSPLRDHMCSVQMIGEDLAQLGNRVDLDPKVKDVWGQPVARITYSLHLHERFAGWLWAPRLGKVLEAAGAKPVYYVPPDLSSLTGANPISSETRHISGTMRMGTDPASSVTDEFGRCHDVGNVVVVDGSVFPTSGAFNPTNTIMSTALRSATALAHGEAQAAIGPVLGT